MKHSFNTGGKQPSAKTGTFRGQPSTKPVNSANNTVQCSNCGTTHPKDRCSAYRVTCFKCNKVGIMLLNVELTVPILLKIQGNLTGFMVEADHLGVEDSLQKGRSMKQLRFLQSNDKSHLDIVRLMEVYGLSNNSPQTSLKQRVQVDDIKVIDIGFENSKFLNERIYYACTCITWSSS